MSILIDFHTWQGTSLVVALIILMEPVMSWLEIWKSCEYDVSIDSCQRYREYWRYQTSRWITKPSLVLILKSSREFNNPKCQHLFHHSRCICSSFMVSKCLWKPARSPSYQTLSSYWALQASHPQFAGLDTVWAALDSDSVCWKYLNTTSPITMTVNRAIYQSIFKMIFPLLIRIRVDQAGDMHQCHSIYQPWSGTDLRVLAGTYGLGCQSSGDFLPTESVRFFYPWLLWTGDIRLWNGLVGNLLPE